MEKFKNIYQSKFQFIKVGFFLALRDLKRSNIWTTSLIVAIMVLTFLNMVVISGILVGLIQGAIDQNKNTYTGDVIISVLQNEKYIKESPRIISFIETLPEIKAFSYRYLTSAQIEANYQRRTKESDIYDRAGGSIVGIDPYLEDQTTNISKYMIEGEFLNGSEDHDSVVLGANLLAKYLDIESPNFRTLKGVETGSKVRLKIGDIIKEVTVKGVIKTKADENDFRIWMISSELKKIAGRSDNNVNEIAIRINSDVKPEYVRDVLLNQGFGENAKIQTAEQAQPKFVEDLKNTFGTLGTLIGGIGAIVASITIFIIIFVNAITRRKFIGIMKGIGVDARAIEFSYIFQSVFYAVIGVVIGSVIVFFLLEPYFKAHPINFPFSDGILAVSVVGTIIRGLILIITTIIAGYIPAKIVVKQNTLSAILGR